MRGTSSSAFRVIVIVAALMACSGRGFAAELVMVGMRACPYCEAFSHEVEPAYAASPEGRIAPLRHVHVRGTWPADLAAVRRARQTPYFILVQDGREVGRFGGYSTPEDFWAELRMLLAEL